MPIYEYKCLHCGHIFEVFWQNVTSGMPPCPECQSDNVARTVSLVSAHFKGLGFHVNDYPKK
jgi:putative FmdB family regulatory protein